MKPKRYPKVLAIAGSDSAGGAGVQADLKTISALGCYALTVITVLTAQNTRAVTGIQSIPAAFIIAQGEAVLSDLGTDAVKIGMLHAAETVGAVASLIKTFDLTNVVLDPVMVSASGARLIEDATLDAIKNELFPLADIITPNLPEAEIILEKKLPTTEARLKGAAELCWLSGRAALLKGGESEGDRGARWVEDFYAERGRRVSVIRHRRVLTTNVHGAGCTLSSAIASHLALGCPLAQAAERSLAFVHRAVAAGAVVRTGGGRGPLNHFFRPRRLRGRY